MLAKIGVFYTSDRWRKDNTGTFLCTMSEPKYAGGINGAGLTKQWRQDDKDIYECYCFGKRK